MANYMLGLPALSGNRWSTAPTMLLLANYHAHNHSDTKEAEGKIEVPTRKLAHTDTHTITLQVLCLR